MDKIGARNVPSSYLEILARVASRIEQSYQEENDDHVMWNKE